eukprot:8473820-Pyramimonas_sp.AAC.1
MALAQHGEIWGTDQTVHIANADLKQAFDHCSLQNAKRAMCHANIPAYLQYALLAPLVCTTGSLIIEGVAVHDINWDVCIRTAGPDGASFIQYYHMCHVGTDIS